MALILIAALTAFALFVAAGRRPARAFEPIRIAFAMLAVVVAVGALIAALHGGWMASLALAGLATFLGSRSRVVPRHSLPSLATSMSHEEARAILGVGPAADRAEIAAAYRRLMKASHPDHGGPAGLAAKVNAARDRLLRRA